MKELISKTLKTKEAEYLHAMNPEPFKPDDQVAFYFDVQFSIEKLVDLMLIKKSISGGQDLNRTESMKCKIDCRKVGASSLGHLMPNLKQLNLNNSYIPLIR
jgi:hypothetical protein